MESWIKKQIEQPKHHLFLAFHPVFHYSNIPIAHLTILRMEGQAASSIPSVDSTPST